jgi:hypothetical protein
MRNDYTHLSVILDRTGSMETIRDDTIGGFNAFLNEQKDAPGYATLTLVQFDSQDPYEVLHRFAAVTAVPELTRATFVPRASTPLLDAIGRGINDLEQSLLQMPEAVRPARVVMVIITDGQENASREFRKEQIARMIKEKQEKLDWQFVFLSADLNAIGDALDVGMRAAAAMAFDKDAQGTRAAFAATSRHVVAYRMAEAPSIAFTEEDRAEQAAEQARRK